MKCLSCSKIIKKHELHWIHNDPQFKVNDLAKLCVRCVDLLLNSKECAICKNKFVYDEKKHFSVETRERVFYCDTFECINLLSGMDLKRI